MPLWTYIIKNIFFADYSSGVIYGDTKKEVDHKIRLAIDSGTGWYRLAGFAIKCKNSEYMRFGFTPEAIILDGLVV